MSRLENLGNPYEFISYLSYGPNLQAVKYEMSDLSLNIWNYEPIYGAILTHTTEAPVPQGLYAVLTRPCELTGSCDSFHWQSPDNGVVTWVCIGVPPEPPTGVPEPGTGLLLAGCLALFALYIALRRSCRSRLNG